MGFADCMNVAITTSGHIPNSEVAYGLYTPPLDTDWHPKWNKKHRTFTHFWVEHEDKIIDNACDQYGEPSEKITDITDIRYVKVGRMQLPYSLSNLIVLRTSPKIHWKSMQNFNVEVEWNEYDIYLKRLEAYERNSVKFR